MSEYFPKQKPLEGSVKVELDSSSYATKSIHQVLLERLDVDVDKLDIGNNW